MRCTLQVKSMVKCVKASQDRRKAVHLYLPGSCMARGGSCKHHCLHFVIETLLVLQQQDRHLITASHTSIGYVASIAAKSHSVVMSTASV